MKLMDRNYHSHTCNKLVGSENQKLLELLVTFIAPLSETSMMPLAPTSTDLPRAQKPKIGFSIDSIVGGSKANNATQLYSSISKRSHQRFSSTDNDEYIKQSSSTSTSSPEPLLTDISIKATTRLLASKHSREIVDSLANSQPHLRFLRDGDDGITYNENIRTQIYTHAPDHLHRFPQGSNNSSVNNSPAIAPPSYNSTTDDNKANTNSIHNFSNETIPEQDHYYKRVNEVNNTDSPISSSASPPVRFTCSLRNSSLQDSDSRKSPPSNSPILSSKPLPPSETCHPPPPPTQHPHFPVVGPHGIPQFAAYPQGMINFAAAAAAAAAHHPEVPGWMPPGLHQPAAHPLYPWLLAKHSRLFPHRFGPGPDLPGFLLQAFRKPKRIRTAFNPSQLLKLEHAFERNHYVVGAERKQLANSLSLSETQVKIWYQNRRTKHKRMQQEEETEGKSRCVSGNSSSGSNLSTSAISADSSTRNYNSEEMAVLSEEEEDDNERTIIMDGYSDQEGKISEHLH